MYTEDGGVIDAREAVKYMLLGGVVAEGFNHFCICLNQMYISQDLEIWEKTEIPKEEFMQIKFIKMVENENKRS